MRNFRMGGAASALAVPLRGGGVFPIPAPVGGDGCHVGGGGGAWLDFEVAPTRALWKGSHSNRALFVPISKQPSQGHYGKRLEAHSLRMQPISKQPSQGHYGKFTRETAVTRAKFRSSPHKGIMESCSALMMPSTMYFEAALTRALWKGNLSPGLKRESISKQPSQGHYGKRQTRAASSC